MARRTRTAPPQGDKPVRHKRKRWVLLGLGAVLLYLLAGALIPFAVHPQVSEELRASFDESAFYGTGSPDRAALVADNQDALALRLRIISEAKERIIFSCFDIRESESGRDIFAALLAAAQRGVEIQILTDGMNGLVSMSPKPMFWALGRLENVEIRYYNTPNLLLPWTFNGRLHDKYFIIDDRLLLLGGRNTFDKFLGDYVPEYQKSHDLDVLLYNTAAGTGRTGESALSQVEDYFHSVWEGDNVKTHLERPPLGWDSPADQAEGELKTRWSALQIAYPGLTEPEAVHYEALTVPIEGARLISNPTHIFSKEPWVWWQMMTLLQGAQDRAYLQMPYAVLGADMYKGLQEVAQAPNEFSMQINSAAVGDNFMASSDYTWNREKVIETGVSLYEYFGGYSSHGKSALVDDDLSMVGSFNLDMRSAYIDTELMLAIHGTEFSDILEAYLLDMEADALRVLPDGSYEEKAGVPVKPVPPPKSWIYPVTSLIFQPFRFLL